MSEGLSKEVETPAIDTRLVAMKKKIAAMQVLYFVLFGLSLVLIVYKRTTYSPDAQYLWAFSLGGAILVRLIRQSMVNKYNALVAGGRPAPLG